MKTPLLLLLLSVASFGVNAQVSGRITTTTGAPVPFVPVVLLHSRDTTLADAGATDERGAYRLSAPKSGSYLLKISGLGYQPAYSSVFSLPASGAAHEMENIVLSEDTRQLAELVVRSAKPTIQQTPEGTIIRVANSVMARGNTVLGMLQQSPGITIDYRNNSLALNGKSGVAVMLNGKLLRLPPDQVVSFLNGMSANNLASIELLTTPGAGHDAEGTAGIINIVTQTHENQGTNASVTLTGGYGWGEKGNGTATVTHQNGRFSLFASYSFLRDRTYSSIGIDSRQDMPFFGGPLHVLVRNTTQARQTNHDAQVSADWRVSARSALRAQVSRNTSSRMSTDWNTARYYLVKDSILYFNGEINGDNRWQSTTGSLDLDTRLRNGASFHAGVDRIYFSSDSPSEVRATFADDSGEPAGSGDSLLAPRQRGYARTGIQVNVGKVDYVQELSRRWKIDAGLKGTFTRNQSEAGIQSLLNGQWVNRTETTGELVMRERIGAAYVSAKSVLSPALTLIFGLRFEYAHTRMTDPQTQALLVDRKQGIFFPNLSLAVRMTDQSELSVSFSKRINRPTYQDLASFVRYSDPSAVYTGNPLLRSGITTNLRVAYSRPAYVLSLLLSQDDNPIARYQLSESPLRNLLYVGPQNLAWQKNITLQLTLPWKVSDWWTMSYDLSGGWRSFRADHTPAPVEKNYIGYSLNTTHTLTLPQKWAVEVSGWLASATYNGTIRVGAMGAVNAGVRKELKKGRIQLTVTDLLRTLHIDSYYGAVTQEAFSIRNHVGIDTESRVFPIVKLTWSRSFGSTGLTKRQDDSPKEERSRLTNP